MVDVTLQVIKAKIFEEIPVPLSNMPQWVVTLEKDLELYHIALDIDDDDLRDVHIPKTKGSQFVEGPEIISYKFLKPLKTKKVNIDSKENS